MISSLSPLGKTRGAILTKMPRKDTREKSRSVRKPPSFLRRLNLIQIKCRCADSSPLANARRELVVNSDIARKHNESFWPLDSQVPALILRIRSISYAGSFQRVLVALATGVNALAMLQFLLGSEIPTAGVPPRKQHLRELHVELLVGPPRGGTPKKDSKGKRHKSPKPSAVAEIMEIDAESPAESSSSSEGEESEPESGDSLYASRGREQESSSSSE